MNTLRYLWAHPYGRVAIVVTAMAIVFGLTGAIFHWQDIPVPLVFGLPRRDTATDLRVTPKRRDDRMAAKCR